MRKVLIIVGSGVAEEKAQELKGLLEKENVVVSIERRKLVDRHRDLEPVVLQPEFEEIVKKAIHDAEMQVAYDDWQDPSCCESGDQQLSEIKAEFNYSKKLFKLDIQRKNVSVRAHKRNHQRYKKETKRY